MIACTAILAACCMMPDAALGQPEKHSVSLLYGVTTPAGDDGFIDQAGFVDLSVEYGIRLTPLLTAGVSAGYGYDRQKKDTDDRYDGDLVSGFSDRNLSVVPVMVWVRLFPWGQEARFQPYAMLGGGVQYARFDIEGDQIDARTVSNWAVAFSPQIGARFFPAAGKKLYLDGRISWRYAANEWPVMDIGSIQRAGFALGAGVKF